MAAPSLAAAAAARWSPLAFAPCQCLHTCVFVCFLYNSCLHVLAAFPGRGSRTAVHAGEQGSDAAV